MHVPSRFRSLLAQSFLWILLPLSLVMVAVLLVGIVSYNNVVSSLLIDRDRQLATFSAERISQILLDYARSLQELGERAFPDGDLRAASKLDVQLEESPEIAELFNAGIMVTNSDGAVLSVEPQGLAPTKQVVAAESYFQDLSDEIRPTFSDVLSDLRTGQDMIIIAAPISDARHRLIGALLGAVHLHTTTLADPVLSLSVGDEGFAYMVDRHGTAIFHPDTSQIGAGFVDREAVGRVIRGESAGLMWESPDEGRIVQGYAPIAGTGWGLIVREPWEDVIDPVRTFRILATLVVVLALAAATYFLWQGGLRITRPIRELVVQTGELATGEKTNAVSLSGILEIDQLAQAFDRMSDQIYSYRAGLRRYAGSIISSQEEERKRIGRELHDETIQSLIAIRRYSELYQQAKDATARQAAMAELQRMLEETIRGIRDINRDLRPLILEDLGFVPAVETQLNSLRTNELQVDFTVSGSARPLPPEYELALFRITQEAANNIKKHAQASEVDVSLEFSDAAVVLQIRDNGVGFSPPDSLTELAQGDQFGLLGVQERAWSLAGSLELTSADQAGTYLRVTLPL